MLTLADPGREGQGEDRYAEDQRYPEAPPEIRDHVGMVRFVPAAPLLVVGGGVMLPGSPGHRMVRAVAPLRHVTREAWSHMVRAVAPAPSWARYGPGVVESASQAVGGSP